MFDGITPQKEAGMKSPKNIAIAVGAMLAIALCVLFIARQLTAPGETVRHPPTALRDQPRSQSGEEAH